MLAISEQSHPRHCIQGHVRGEAASLHRRGTRRQLKHTLPVLNLLLHRHRSSCQQPRIAASRLLMAAAQEQSTVTDRRVTFQNANHETLVGLLRDCGNQAAILCHGWKSTKEQSMFAQLADRLEAEGLTTLRFDFSGNGESEGGFHYGNYKAEAEDLRAAVQFLQGQGFKVEAILGHSKGGDCMVTYAARYDDIPKVVNVSGRFWCNTGITERFGEGIIDKVKAEGSVELPDGPHGQPWSLTNEDVQERINTDMEANCKAIKQSRVLTIHGSDDKTISVENAEEFSKWLPGNRLHVIKGADHNFQRQEHTDELINTAVKFITSS